jgi:hypothetical protein
VKTVVKFSGLKYTPFIYPLASPLAMMNACGVCPNVRSATAKPESHAINNLSHVTNNLSHVINTIPTPIAGDLSRESLNSSDNYWGFEYSEVREEDNNRTDVVENWYPHYCRKEIRILRSWRGGQSLNNSCRKLVSMLGANATV